MDPNYYAVIPANVRYDEALKPNAKLLYGEITALCGREGFCWADNAYFAGLYNVDTNTVSRWISQLRERGYVWVKVFPDKANLRHIGIDEKVNTYRQKSIEVSTKKTIGIDEKVKPIYENITINNTKNRESALAFLKTEFSGRYETEFLMKYQTALAADFEKFCADFDDTITIELTQNKITWDGTALLARIGKYARSWIQNNANRVQGKNGVQQEPEKIFRRKLI